MKYFKSFSDKIKTGQVGDFEGTTLELFRYQAEKNPVYRSYIKARGVDAKGIKRIVDIPFLPVSFFKTHQVVTGTSADFPVVYTSSGTTGTVNSRHYVWSEDFYLAHAARVFEAHYGSLDQYHVLALLPSYLERQGSSLVAMVDHFIKKSQSAESGFYLYDHEALLEKLDRLREGQKKILLIGVTFALLDLAEKAARLPANPNLIIMETGGMKGRRREMIREEVHDVLKSAFGAEQIHSEYGMTEMMSQAYSKGEGIYTKSAWVGVYIRDTHDPFNLESRKSGGINVVDLANFHSCAFIETQDLGTVHADGSFKVLGRMDNSEIRGCNLMAN
ncbi:acyl transferase [Negadavirga shengliensis]|uniref:Acyl transferase n=1 Tax=Negadavirga shengliensis TaxID=1389218 RepID=A0ABV9T4J2_9BACT